MAPPGGRGPEFEQRREQRPQIAMPGLIQRRDGVAAGAGLQAQLMHIVAQHGLVQERCFDFALDAGSDVDGVGHVHHPAREIPAFVHAMWRKPLREMLRMMLVELRGPVHLIHRMSDADVVLVVFVKRAVGVERDDCIGLQTAHVVDEPFTQLDFAGIAQTVCFPAEFNDFRDPEHGQRCVHLRRIGGNGFRNAQANRVIAIIGNAQQHEPRTAIRHEAQRATDEQRRIIRVCDDHENGVSHAGQPRLLCRWPAALRGCPHTLHPVLNLPPDAGAAIPPASIPRPPFVSAGAQ